MIRKIASLSRRRLQAVTMVTGVGLALALIPGQAIASVSIPDDGLEATFAVESEAAASAVSAEDGFIEIPEGMLPDATTTPYDLPDGMSAIVQPVAGSSTIIDSFVTMTSVNYNKTNKTLTVILKVKKDIPQRAGFSLSWRYASATRNRADYSLTSIDGLRKGTKVVTLKNVPTYRMVAFATITLARPYATSQKAVLIDSGARTTGHLVNKTEVAAKKVLTYVPGAVLTYLPQTRFIRFAGATVLGWTIFADVKKSISMPSKCPELAAGQYIVTSSSLARQNNSAILTTTVSVYHKKTDYTSKKAPACAVTTKASWT